MGGVSKIGSRYMKAFTLLVMFFCVDADYMDKFTLRVLVELYAFDLDVMLQ